MQPKLVTSFIFFLLFSQSAFAFIGNPTRATLSVSPGATVEVDQKFTLTLQARDEDGVVALYIWDGSEWKSKNCEWKKECTFSITLSKKTPGKYTFFGYADGWNSIWNRVERIQATPNPKKYLFSNALEIEVKARPPQPSSTFQECKDLDGGSNIFSKGKAFLYRDGKLFKEEEDSCLDSSTLKEFRCLGFHLVYDLVHCPQGCEDGACKRVIGSCTDECKPPERRCAGAEGYQICGNYDDDPCLEWSSPIKCPSPETCREGECFLLIDIKLPPCPFSGENGIWAKPKNCSWGDSLARIKLGSGKCGSCKIDRFLFSLQDFSIRTFAVVGYAKEQLGRDIKLYPEEVEFCVINPVPIKRSSVCPFDLSRGTVLVKPSITIPNYLSTTWTSDYRCVLGGTCKKESPQELVRNIFYYLGIFNETQWQLATSTPIKIFLSPCDLFRKITGFNFPISCLGISSQDCAVREMEFPTHYSLFGPIGVPISVCVAVLFESSNSTGYPSVLAKMYGKGYRTSPSHIRCEKEGGAYIDLITFSLPIEICVGYVYPRGRSVR